MEQFQPFPRYDYGTLQSEALQEVVVYIPAEEALPLSQQERMSILFTIKCRIEPWYLRIKTTLLILIVLFQICVPPIWGTIALLSPDTCETNMYTYVWFNTMYKFSTIAMVLCVIFLQVVVGVTRLEMTEDYVEAWMFFYKFIIPVVLVMWGIYAYFEDPCPSPVYQGATIATIVAWIIDVIENVMEPSKF